MSAAFDYSGLPDDDYLVQARRADLELAAREAAACRRPISEYVHRDIGSTEAWERREELRDLDAAGARRLAELLSELDPADYDTHTRLVTRAHLRIADDAAGAA